MTNTQKLFVPLLMTGTLLFSTTANANTRPVAEKQNITVEEDSSQLITLVANDKDGDELTYKIIRKPRKGILSKISDTEYTYTPTKSFHGKDRFLFRVNDGKASSRLAQVRIAVMEVADGVSAKDITITGKENTKSIITLQGMGESTTGTSYSIETNPINGIVVMRNNKAIYQPNLNFNGTDSFTYIYSDDVDGSSSPATIMIKVKPVNSRPTAENMKVKAVKNIVNVIALNGSDIEDKNLSFEIIRKPRKGTLSDLNGNITEYSPKAGFIGKDSFSYRLIDVEGRRSRIARVKLDVIDHIPTAENLTVGVTKNEVKKIILKGDDIADDNATLVYEIIDPPSHGVLGDLTGATLDYTSVEGYVGEDSFMYQVINSVGALSSIAKVQLNIKERIVAFPARAKIMLCGYSYRNISDFNINKSITFSCIPDNDTQVMFVTRSGVQKLQSSGLSNYISGGGIIITEYNITHTVYNKIFGTNLNRGSSHGSCLDNVMPVNQQNSNDIFWKNNSFISIGSQSGCGFNISHLPNITPLGGWSNNSVQLAYIDIGKGRLWLVEADWQDGEEDGYNRGGINQASKDLMNYMANHRANGIEIEK